MPNLNICSAAASKAELKNRNQKTPNEDVNKSAQKIFQ